MACFLVIQMQNNLGNEGTFLPKVNLFFFPSKINKLIYDAIWWIFSCITGTNGMWKFDIISGILSDYPFLIIFEKHWIDFNFDLQFFLSPWFLCKPHLKIQINPEKLSKWNNTFI